MADDLEHEPTTAAPALVPVPPPEAVTPSSIVDWGDSANPSGGLATLQEVHNHKRDERRFQLHIVIVFVIFAALMAILQAYVAAIVAKDIILITLPVFTFVLGKLEGKSG